MGVTATHSAAHSVALSMIIDRVVNHFACLHYLIFACLFSAKPCSTSPIWTVEQDRGGVQLESERELLMVDVLV